MNPPPPMSRSELSRELVQRGLLDRNAPAPEAASDRPWFIGAVLGAAGWLAGVFALAFVELLFKPDSAADFVLAGVVMLSAAFGLYTVDRESAFFDQLALALSIAGQLALAIAAWETTDSAAGTAALVALLQGALLFAMPNRLAKLLAAFFACIAWALAVRFASWGEWTFGSDRRQVDMFPALVGWLVIWLPIIALTHVLVATEMQWLTKGWHRIVRPSLSGLIASLAIGTWVSEPFGSLTFWVPPGDTYTNWLALWPLLAAAAALFAATCAFRLRHNGLVGLAVVGALLHVVQFYYLLGASLLTKASIMLGVGAALLFAAAQTARRRPIHPGSET